MSRLADKLNWKGRRGELVAGAATVLVLVAVVLLFSALGSPGDISGPQDASPPAAQAQKLAIEAGEALAAGDTTLAIELADEAMSLDQTNESAANVKRQARTARTTTSSAATLEGSNDSPPNSTKPVGAGSEVDESVFLSNLDDVARLLPKSFSDFSMGDVTTVERDAQVTGTAKKLSNPARQITWVIHGFDDRDSAESFVNKTSRQFYSTHPADVRVDGADGYFGTDGTRYATAVYVRGRYVFEVLVAGDVDPKQHKELAIAAAIAFSDSYQ